MITNILLILPLLILSAKLLGGLFERLGLDSTLGELLTGIVFGVSVLHLVSAESIESFAVIGSVLILFVTGLKQRDIQEIYHDKGSMRIGLLLLIATTLAMAAFFYLMPPAFGIRFSVVQSLIMGLAFGIIDVGVPAKVLISTGLISQPVGKLAVRAAIVNILVGLLIFTIPTAIGHPADMATKLVGMLLFVVIAVALVVFLSRVTRLVMKAHVEEAEFSLAIILVLFLSYLTEVIGFSSVLGAFVAGVLVSRMPFAETKSFSDKVKSISFGLFVPLFFVWFGLVVDIAEIWRVLGLAALVFLSYAGLRFAIAYASLRHARIATPGLVSASMLSVDVESLLILMVAMKAGIFADSTPLTLFAPSVFLSTLAIVVLVPLFTRRELGQRYPG